MLLSVCTQIIRLKTLFILSVVLFFSYSTAPTISYAAVIADTPGNFITTWNTENPGSSANNQITIPGTGSGYSYEIYWEDTTNENNNGTTSVITTSSFTLTFPAPGIYEVQISGTFPRIFFNNGGDKDKILTIEQWGSTGWRSMDSAFNGARNLRVPAIDAPDLSTVTTMRLMFGNTANFNDPINHWDVSNITSMERLFFNATAFNQPLNDWDVSNVNRFNATFQLATSFNQPLNDWELSTSTSIRMDSMFCDAWAFNQPLDNWNVSRVTNTTYMFCTTPFNQDISGWNTGNITTMSGMFIKSDFNQDISGWDTSAVTAMDNMFRMAPHFDQDISNWDLSSITDMSRMFEGQIEVSGNGRSYGDVTGLSQANQDAFLSSLANQAISSNINNISLHIGNKSYTGVGAVAIATLQGLGWIISEQYTAEYWPSQDASIIGDNIQTLLTRGATTTQITLNPNSNCTFIRWSDGNTSNPRQDVITDNIAVTAELDCRSSSSGSSAGGRALALERQGRPEEAAAIRSQYDLDDTQATGTPIINTSPKTLEESLVEIERLPSAIEKIVGKDSSPETARSLVTILLEIVEVLTLLMVLDTEVEA